MTSGRVTVVAALVATQTIAWASSYYMPAILGAPIARALHLPTSIFFGLFSGALLLSAAVGPSVGRVIDAMVDAICCLEPSHCDLDLALRPRRTQLDHRDYPDCRLCQHDRLATERIVPARVWLACHLSGLGWLTHAARCPG